MALLSQHINAQAEELKWNAETVYALSCSQIDTEWQAARKSTIDSYEQSVKELKDKTWAALQEELNRLEASGGVSGDENGAGTTATEGEDINIDDSHANNNVTPVLPSRPKRITSSQQQSQAAPTNSTFCSSTTVGSQALSTLVTEQELYEDLQVVFPEEVSRSGFLKRSGHLSNNGVASSTTSSGLKPPSAPGALDIRIEGHVGYYQGHRFVKGDRIAVVQGDHEQVVYTGIVSGVSGNEITMRPDEHNDDDPLITQGRLRMPLGSIRAGKWILSFPFE